MALTKKMLVAMDIPAEKIDEIMSNHLASIDALREERDGYKASAEKLATVEKALDKANAELETFKSGDWEKKYNDLKSEYTTFKTATETKAVKAAKESAYKQLLLDAGISDKRIASIMRVSDIDGVTLDKDGKIENADKLAESVKTEWADFIVTEETKGAETPKPAESTGGTPPTPSRAAQLVAQYRSEHYGTKEE